MIPGFLIKSRRRHIHKCFLRRPAIQQNKSGCGFLAIRMVITGIVISVDDRKDVTLT